MSSVAPSAPVSDARKRKHKRKRSASPGRASASGSASDKPAAKRTKRVKHAPAPAPEPAPAPAPEPAPVYTVEQLREIYRLLGRVFETTSDVFEDATETVRVRRRGPPAPWHGDIPASEGAEGEEDEGRAAVPAPDGLVEQTLCYYVCENAGEEQFLDDCNGEVFMWRTVGAGAPKVVFCWNCVLRMVELTLEALDQNFESLETFIESAGDFIAECDPSNDVSRAAMLDAAQLIARVRARAEAKRVVLPRSQMIGQLLAFLEHAGPQRQCECDVVVQADVYDALGGKCGLCATGTCGHCCKKIMMPGEAVFDKLDRCSVCAEASNAIKDAIEHERARAFAAVSSKPASSE